MSLEIKHDSSACSLCQAGNETLVFSNDRWRVIQAQEEHFPAFYRVIWQRHVAEFSDLSEGERNDCMHAVVEVEKIIKSQLQPTKINLAALGNKVPHLHWHVIARFDWDSHFPAPIWDAPQRPLAQAHLLALRQQCVALNRLMALQLAQIFR